MDGRVSESTKSAKIADGKDAGICDSTTNVSDSEVNPSAIKEGRAEILLKSSSSHVFYNPVQEFNRDLSIAVLSVFAKEQPQSRKGLKRNRHGSTKDATKATTDGSSTLVNSREDGISVFEALAATGLRSIRYALEVPGIREIVANDLSFQAVESIEDNVKHNKVERIVQTSHSDASLSMYLSKGENKLFDAVDLDPYGCPSRFLDATAQVLEEGGLALVTATDLAVLAGNSPETCYSKYGAVCLRSPACHEMALRIVLQCIESHANRYGKYIVPLLSISADFYVRVFVRIFTSPATCKQSTSKLSHVFQCVGCKCMTLHPLGVMNVRENKPPSYSLPRLPELSKCPHCDHSYQMGGPVWSGPLHDPSFISKLLELVESSSDKFNTSKRMLGMLSVAKNELLTPFFYTIDAVCSIVHCVSIPLITFRSALSNAGYKVSETHAAPNSVKTDAPAEVIWDIVRTWVKNGHPVSEKRIKESDVTKRILEAPVRNDIRFDFNADAGMDTEGLVRFQVNPAPYWGPGLRAKNNLVDGCATKEAKRKANQNKSKPAAVENVESNEVNKK
uniref:tRNA (guanine(26)-N(2))-dimethyltransferase n=1 Tax=Lygus hesperus TaxID=30085 RepID=A0A0A9ZAV4_LYGHE